MAETASSSPPEREGLRWNAWNLLLLVPLLMLVTPWFNAKEQFLFVPVGVVCVWVVYAMTKDEKTSVAPGPEPDVDSLDEGVTR